MKRRLTPDEVAALPMPDRGPRRGGAHRELLGVLQAPRLLLHTPRLALAPRGSGRPVIDLPGWRSPEAANAPLRAYLRHLGHDARSWGIGTNHGDVRGYVDRMEAHVADVADDTGDQVALVGWSLGGTIAREVARRRPADVRRVITMGSPLVGLPHFTVFSDPSTPERIAQRLERQRVHETDNPLAVPLTSIYTRRDRVVAWPASIDRFSADAEHVEVASTHLSLGIDPDVWLVIADRLAG